MPRQPETTQQRVERHIRYLYEDVQTAGLTLLQFEEMIRKHLVEAALNTTGWNICKAARLVGLHRNGLSYRIQRYGLQRPEGTCQKMLCKCGVRISRGHFSKHMKLHARRGDLYIVKVPNSHPRYKWLREPQKAVA